MYFFSLPLPYHNHLVLDGTTAIDLSARVNRIDAIAVSDIKKKFGLGNELFYHRVISAASVREQSRGSGWVGLIISRPWHLVQAG